MILHWLTLPWITGGALESLLFTISWLCLLYAGSVKLHEKMGKPVPKFELKKALPYIAVVAAGVLMRNWRLLFK